MSGATEVFIGHLRVPSEAQKEEDLTKSHGLLVAEIGFPLTPGKKSMARTYTETQWKTTDSKQLQPSAMIYNDKNFQHNLLFNLQNTELTLEQHKRGWVWGGVCATLHATENLCITYSWPCVPVDPPYLRFHRCNFNQLSIVLSVVHLTLPQNSMNCMGPLTQGFVFNSKYYTSVMVNTTQVEVG